MLEKKNQVERKVNKESVRVVFVHEENDSLKKKKNGKTLSCESSGRKKKSQYSQKVIFPPLINLKGLKTRHSLCFLAYYKEL